MERLKRLCDEVRVFDAIAERTGEKVEIQNLKSYRNACTSMTDLTRKHRLLGDGLYYLAVGSWHGGPTVTLDNVKWKGFSVSLERQRKTRRPPNIVSDSEDEER